MPDARAVDRFRRAAYATALLGVLLVAWGVAASSDMERLIIGATGGALAATPYVFARAIEEFVKEQRRESREG